MQIGNWSRLRNLAAAILVAAIMLSTWHAVAPHHAAQGPCVACQTLTAPALVPAPEISGLALESRLYVPTRRGAEPLESPAPPLQPKRAPPASTIA